MQKTVFQVFVGDFWRQVVFLPFVFKVSMFCHETIEYWLFGSVINPIYIAIYVFYKWLNYYTYLHSLFNNYLHLQLIIPSLFLNLLL